MSGFHFKGVFSVLADPGDNTPENRQGAKSEGFQRFRPDKELCGTLVVSANQVLL